MVSRFIQGPNTVGDSVLSSYNSTTTAIDAGVTYTGDWEDVTRFNSVVVAAKSDVPGTLYMEFSRSGTGNADSTLTYLVAAGVNEVHRLTVTRPFYRTRYLNAGTNQATFEITTMYGGYTALAAPLNLALGADADATVTRAIVTGQPFLNGVRASLQGALNTGENHFLAGEVFAGTTLDTNYWTSTLANDGTVVQANGGVRLRTNTTADGSASLASVSYAHFIPGRPNTAAFTVAFSHTGTANNTAEWGVGTANDGIFFRLSGTTMYVVVKNAGAEIAAIASTAWNKSTVVPTLTNVNIYEIHYALTGCFFVINGVLAHQFSLLGQSTNLGGVVSNISLPVRISNTNSSSATDDLSMYVGGALIFGVGSGDHTPVYKNIATASTTVCSTHTGRLVRIVLNTAAAGTIKLYDALTATNIFASIAVSNSDLPISWEFGTQFNTGLTVVTSGSTNITVIFE